MATIAQARLKACRMWPYGAQAILSLLPVECEHADMYCAAVDKYWRLYYKPSVTDAMSIDELALIVLHEVSHLLFVHHRRLEMIVPSNPTEIEAFLWNLATDAAINDALREEGHAVTQNWILPEQFNFPQGLTSEQYYRLFVQEAQKKNGKIKIIKVKAGRKEGNAGAGESGSCADGKSKPWEVGEPSPDAPGMEPHQQDRIVREVAKSIANREAGKGRGFGKWAQEAINPKVDPRQLFMRFAKRSMDLGVGRGDYSYRRPSRRSPPFIVLPSSVRPIPRILGIIDTSGSMNRTDTGLAVGLMGKTINALRIRDGLKLLCGGTAVESVQKVFGGHQIELAEGGGTDMRVLLEAATKEKPRPHVILICTDGYTDWPKHDIGIPTVAAITQEGQMRSVPKWIRSVYLGA